MQVVRQRPRRRLPTVVRQPRRLNQFLDALRASHCPAEKPVVLIVFDIGRSENLPLVAARPRGRDLVHVPAHEHRRVAGLGQRAGQRRRRDRLPKEPHDAARLRVQAGQQGIPRRDAGRHRGIGAAEECPLLGQFIQLRCPHARMAQDRQAIAPHLIRHQEEHIRLGGLALRSAKRHRAQGKNGQQTQDQIVPAHGQPPAVSVLPSIESHGRTRRFFDKPSTT